MIYKRGIGATFLAAATMAATACQPLPSLERPGTLREEIFGTVHQTVQINLYPEEAKCEVNGDDFQTSFEKSTLIFVSVKASPVEISCKKDGHNPTQRSLLSSQEMADEVAGMVAGAMIGGGLAAGLGAAIASEAAGRGYFYPPIVHIVLEPEDLGARKPSWMDARKQEIKNNWSQYTKQQKWDCDNQGPVFRYCVPSGFRKHLQRDLAAFPPETATGMLLKTDEIKKAFADNSIWLSAHSGLSRDEGSWSFKPDGKLSGSRTEVTMVANQDMADASGSDSDLGEWWAENDRFCFRWSRWENGVAHCYFIVRNEGKFEASGQSGRFNGNFTFRD